MVLRVDEARLAMAMDPGAVMNATPFTRRTSLFVGSQRYSPTRSFLATPARIAIAGDWHADTDYGVVAIEHAAKRDATVLVQLGDSATTSPTPIWTR